VSQLGGGAFFGGTAPMYSDFAIWHVCDNTRAIEPGALNGEPRLGEWFDRVRALPAVEEYLQGRPARGVGGAAKGGVGLPGSLMADWECTPP